MELETGPWKKDDISWAVIIFLGCILHFRGVHRLFRAGSTDSLVITLSCCITVACVTDETWWNHFLFKINVFLIGLDTMNSFIGKEWTFISLWCSCCDWYFKELVLYHCHVCVMYLCKKYIKHVLFHTRHLTIYFYDRFPTSWQVLMSTTPDEVNSALKLNFNTTRLKAGRSMGNLMVKQVGRLDGCFFSLTVGWEIHGFFNIF